MDLGSILNQEPCRVSSDSEKKPQKREPNGHPRSRNTLAHIVTGLVNSDALLSPPSTADLAESDTTRARVSLSFEQHQQQQQQQQQLLLERQKQTSELQKKEQDAALMLEELQGAQQIIRDENVQELASSRRSALDSTKTSLASLLLHPPVRPISNSPDRNICAASKASTRFDSQQSVQDTTFTRLQGPHTRRSKKPSFGFFATTPVTPHVASREFSPTHTYKDSPDKNLPGGCSASATQTNRISPASSDGISNQTTSVWSFSRDARPSEEDAIQRLSMGISVKQFGCSTCIKRFARKSDLVRHERIHTGVRPNVCQICKKQFIQRSALNVHMRVHTGEKPHRCALCSKAFSDSSSLARHRRIHTNTKPYSCKVPGCEKAYTRRTTLNKHYFGAHDGWDKVNARAVSSSSAASHLSSASSFSSCSPSCSISRQSTQFNLSTSIGHSTQAHSSLANEPYSGILSQTSSPIHFVSKIPSISNASFSTDYYGPGADLAHLHHFKRHYYDHPTSYLLTSGDS